MPSPVPHAPEPSFAGYYAGPFRADLEAAYRTRPPRGHRHNWSEPTFQPSDLGARNARVRGMDAAHRARFAVALFLTVLADQVCWTHFPAAYPAFRALTEYPKLRGECLSACMTHVHPSCVLRAVGATGSPSPSDRPFPAHLLPPDTLATLRREIVTFCAEILPGVHPEAFWEGCWREFPVELRLLATHGPGA